MHTQSIISKRINAIIYTCCNFDIIDLIHALVVLSLSLLVLHKISFSMDDIFILK